MLFPSSPKFSAIYSIRVSFVETLSITKYPNQFRILYDVRIFKTRLAWSCPECDPIAVLLFFQFLSLLLVLESLSNSSSSFWAALGSFNLSKSEPLGLLWLLVFVLNCLGGRAWKKAIIFSNGAWSLAEFCDLFHVSIAYGNLTVAYLVEHFWLFGSVDQDSVWALSIHHPDES